MALDYFRPNVSGLTLYAEQLAGGLARRGHAVSVLTHRHVAGLPAESEEEGVRVLRAPVAARLGKALISPALLQRARREVPAADVLHLHAPLVNAVPLAFLAATYRVPLVVTYHCDLQPPVGLAQRFVEVVARACQNFALERAQRVVASTEDYARHTPSLADRIDRVTWILPPIAERRESGRGEAEARTRFGLRGRPIVLFLGRFAEEKGLFHLLDALPRLRARFPEATLVLAGEKNRVPGEMVGARLDPLLADPSSGVVATGFVPAADLADLFRAADVLVLPSTNSTESFGLVQVEAMLQGVPVVASDLPGVRQPVRMTGMGEVAPVGDPEGLARQILRVLESPERYRRPREQIRALFSIESTLTKYEAVYRSAAGASD